MTEQIEKAEEDNFRIDLSEYQQPDNTPQERAVEISLRSIILFLLKKAGAIGQIFSTSSRWEHGIKQELENIASVEKIEEELEALLKDEIVVKVENQLGTAGITSIFYRVAPGVKLEIK